MAAPTDRPKWAATDVNLPNTGAPNKQQPSTTLQDVGIDFGQVPTAEEENWWKNNVYDWVQYIIDEKFPSVEASITGSSPRGVVMAYAFDSEPTGWIQCDGRVLDALTPYTDLRTDLINAGFPYGQDGSSNPKVPDLRGEFLRGVDNGRGVDAGRVFGSSQADELKAHTHTTTGQRTDYLQQGANGSAMYTGVGTPVATSSTGGSETRPRNVAMHYIIKT